MDSASLPSRSSARASIKEDEPFHFTWQLGLAFTSLCIIVLMAALDATSLSVAFPHMANSLNGSTVEIFWAGTGFLITGAVFQPVIGSLSSILGRKLLTFTSLALFAVGAIVAAIAHNVTLLLVGRCIQGVGGGGVIVLSEVLTTDLLPLRVRGQWQGLIAVMWALGTVGGPLMGKSYRTDSTDGDDS
jgi:MFS family permease